jgi:hypothetical protein
MRLLALFLRGLKILLPLLLFLLRRFYRFLIVIECRDADSRQIIMRPNIGSVGPSPYFPPPL